jgi:hypothetical protein
MFEACKLVKHAVQVALLTLDQTTPDTPDQTNKLDMKGGRQTAVGQKDIDTYL